MDIIGLLLNYGANINMQTESRNTPLIWACRQGHYEAALYVVKCGAHIHLLDKVRLKLIYIFPLS